MQPRWGRMKRAWGSALILDSLNSNSDSSPRFFHFRRQEWCSREGIPEGDKEIYSLRKVTLRIFLYSIGWFWSWNLSAIVFVDQLWFCPAIAAVLGWGRVPRTFSLFLISSPMPLFLYGDRVGEQDTFHSSFLTSCFHFFSIAPWKVVGIVRCIAFFLFNFHSVVRFTTWMAVCNCNQYDWCGWIRMPLNQIEMLDCSHAKNINNPIHESWKFK